MNKKTKILIGVGAAAAVAYYFWNNSKTTEKGYNGIGAKLNQSGSDSTYAVSPYRDPFTACPSGYNYFRHNTVVITCKSKNGTSQILVARNK
jgi:hypothetical protein